LTSAAETALRLSFFFSSRRRHTRFSRDWSSDVCSSDLYEQVVGAPPEGLGRPCRIYAPVGTHETLLAYLVRRLLENGANTSFVKIGRASCRERVWIAGGAESCEK